MQEIDKLLGEATRIQRRMSNDDMPDREIKALQGQIDEIHDDVKKLESQQSGIIGREA